jgi:hypothetical protein
MKKLVLAALAASAMSTPAFAANNDTGTVGVSGTVAGRCLFTTNSQTITVGELAKSGSDANAGKLDSSVLVNQTKTLVGWCNKTASTMTVTAKPMLGTTAAPNTSFDSRIDLTASAVANNQTATDGSAGETVNSYTAGSPATVGIFSGNVVVTLTGASTPNNGILTEGTYTGSVDVTLTPAV